MLNELGFTTQFKATPIGFLSLKTGKLYKPEEIKVTNFYRFEEESNSSDKTVLCAIKTNLGEQGVFNGPYGLYNDADVMNDVDLVDNE
jgi:hypothetical protein